MNTGLYEKKLGNSFIVRLNGDDDVDKHSLPNLDAGKIAENSH